MNSSSSSRALGNSIGHSNDMAITSTALIRGCVMGLRSFSTRAVGVTSMGNGNVVRVASTALVRGVVIGLTWAVGFGLGGFWNNYTCSTWPPFMWALCMGWDLAKVPFLLECFLDSKVKVSPG